MYEYSARISFQYSFFLLFHYLLIINVKLRDFNNSFKLSSFFTNEHDLVSISNVNLIDNLFF